MKLTFNKSHNLSQLHDELLDLIPAVRPIGGVPVMTVEGQNDFIILTFANDLSVDDQAMIALLVSNHIPRVATVEDWSQNTGLAGKLFGSAIHIKLRTQAQTNSVCAIALTEIMAAINGHNPALLGLGLNGAIAGLGAAGQPATVSEINQLQTWLADCHIEVALIQPG